MVQAEGCEETDRPLCYLRNITNCFTARISRQHLQDLQAQRIPQRPQLLGQLITIDVVVLGTLTY